MTSVELTLFENRFKEITESPAPDHIKSTRLATLMSDLENVYDIPMLRSEKFEKQNPQIMEFYRKVSNARVF